MGGDDVNRGVGRKDCGAPIAAFPFLLELPHLDGADWRSTWPPEDRGLVQEEWGWRERTHVPSVFSKAAGGTWASCTRR